MLPTWMWTHCTDLRLLPRLFRGTEIPYPAPELIRLAKAVARGGGNSSQEGWAATLHSSAMLSARVSWERRKNRQERKRAASSTWASFCAADSRPAWTSCLPDAPGKQEYSLELPCRERKIGRMEQMFLTPKVAVLIFHYLGLIKRLILWLTLGIQLQEK